MAIDPRDVSELQRALNDAAGKASALWTTFVTFALYLAISFGSVTHRDLFLENPVRLPLLGVDLPLTAFFAVAPTVFVIFHFYVYLQLINMGRKARDYNRILRIDFDSDSDRQLIRQRIDAFVLAQLVAGPREQRLGLTGLSLRFIAWVTLVAAPISVLLLAQLTFLPYHLAWITWIERAAVIVDLSLCWVFGILLWAAHSAPDRQDSPRSPTLLKALQRKLLAIFPRLRAVFSSRRFLERIIGASISLAIAWFSIFVARLPDERLAPLASNFQVEWLSNWTDALYTRLFSTLDSAGTAAATFSNRLILTDVPLVAGERQQPTTVSRSFRNRDLRYAVLKRLDLRNADFIGADLSAADLSGSDLRAARLTCPPEALGSDAAFARSVDVLLTLQIYFDRSACTNLFKARINNANLDDSDLRGAILSQATLFNTSMRGADLSYVKADGLSFSFGNLERATIHRADFTGSSFRMASMVNIYAARPIFFGATFIELDARGAVFLGADLRGSEFSSSRLDAVRFDGADLTGGRFLSSGLDIASFRFGRLVSVAFEVDGPGSTAAIRGADFSGASAFGLKTDRIDLQINVCDGVKLTASSLSDMQIKDFQYDIARVPDASRQKALEDVLKVVIRDTSTPDSAASNRLFEECRSLDREQINNRLATSYIGAACSESSAPDQLAEMSGGETRHPITEHILADFLRGSSDRNARFTRRPDLARLFVESYFSTAQCKQSRADLPAAITSAVRKRAEFSGYALPTN